MNVDKLKVPTYIFFLLKKCLLFRIFSLFSGFVPDNDDEEVLDYDVGDISNFLATQFATAPQFEDVFQHKKAYCWKFFLLDKMNRKTKCKICSQIMTLQKNGSTNNFYKHLKNRHRIIKGQEEFVNPLVLQNVLSALEPNPPFVPSSGSAGSSGPEPNVPSSGDTEPNPSLESNPQPDIFLPPLPDPLAGGEIKKEKNS